MRRRLFTRGAAALATTAALMVIAGPARSATSAQPGSDFNGDGYQDIAIGGPGGTVDGLGGAGYVTIVYGSKNGIDPANGVTISQASAGVPDDPEEGDAFGSSLAAGDFNGDGFADLAVGSLGESIDGNTTSGSVTVLFGSADGLGNGYLVPGDRAIGSAVGAGDVNGDGQVDLLVGSRSVYVTGTVDTYSFPHGGYDNPTISLGGEDGWGGEDGIATGDVNGDGYTDVLAAWTAVGGTPEVYYLPGSANGIQGDARALVDGGVNIAVGDIDKDGHADLVAGQPGGYTGGQIEVEYGTANGFTGGRVQTIDQNTSGVPGTSVYGDQFGSAVAVGDVDGDGYPDVAVGAQSKTVHGATAAGEVVVLRGGESGLTTANAKAFTQDSSGVPDTAEQGDEFGWLISLIDHNADGRADLTASAVGENKSWDGATYGAGVVTTLPGSRSGTTTKNAMTFGPAAFGQDPTDARYGWAITP